MHLISDETASRLRAWGTGAQESLPVKVGVDSFRVAIGKMAGTIAYYLVDATLGHPLTELVTNEHNNGVPTDMLK